MVTVVKRMLDYGGEEEARRRASLYIAELIESVCPLSYLGAYIDGDCDLKGTSLLLILPSHLL